MIKADKTHDNISADENQSYQGCSRQSSLGTSWRDVLRPFRCLNMHYKIQQHMMSRFSDRNDGGICGFRKYFLFFVFMLYLPAITIGQHIVGEDAASGATNSSQYVYVDSDGRLVYKSNGRGDVIPDFSHAGYRGGGVALPDVPIKIRLNPQQGDNTLYIHQALDRVGKIKLSESGYRGAVYLNPGRYEIAGTLHIRNSGLALLGAGDHEGGTLLIATAADKGTLIQIGGEGEFEEVPGTQRDITDSYVPVGARSFSVADAGGFRVGDQVIIYRPSTSEWISAIGMDKIPLDTVGSPTIQWTEGRRDLKFDRIITAINGNKITIDAPLTHSLDQDYGGGYIFAYSFPGRLNEVGIGFIRAVTEWRGVLGLGRDEELVGHQTTYVRDFTRWQGGDRDNPPAGDVRASHFVSFNAVQNAWMTNVTVCHFSAGASSVGASANGLPFRTAGALSRFPALPVVVGTPFLSAGIWCWYNACMQPMAAMTLLQAV